MYVSSKPEKVRVSIGSAIVLGLVKGMLDAEPTTIYLLTYIKGKCSANCAFCPQAKTCLLYTSPSPRDKRQSRMPSSA